MKVLAVIGGAALLAIGATQANATIYLALQNSAVNGGAVTFVGSDNNTGLLAYSGTYGSFVNSITVQGYPQMTQPQLQTGSINSSSQLAGKLTIYVTQTNLNSFTGGLESSFTSNSFLGAAQSVALSTFVSAGNSDPTLAAFNPGTQLATRTFTGIGAQAFTSNVGTLTGPWSQTAKYEINFGSGGASVNDTVNFAAGAVPEPATWALMLAGFGFIGASLRQRRRAAVSFG